jgi:hypothetical protein
MPVKRYEVDGNPYDVSDAKEQEFLSKFSNAVFIGVLDEEGVVVEQEIKDETQDFPTSAAADADVVQPMTASQAGVTELLSEDTSSDSQDPKKLVDSFDEDLLSAKTKLQEISLSNEEIDAIKIKANTAPSVRGVGMGATTIKIYPYDDFIEEAKKEIATETKVDIYSIPEKDWRERAKNLYIKNEEKTLFEAKREEVVEDYEKSIYGENPFSFARLKKFARQIGPKAPGQGNTVEDYKYKAGIEKLSGSFKEDEEEALVDYKNTISSINDYETLLNTAGVELNALRKKQADSPSKITAEDVERGKALTQNQKIIYDLYADEFNKLEDLEIEAKTAAELADLTKRTYNNLDVATNRIASAGTRAIAGFGSVSKELTVSQIIKRTTGIDVRDEEGNLPVYLRNTTLDFYDKIFGSEEAEKTISNLYSLTKKIDEGTKERQELGEIKNIEDFGEFMLDLFSEQSVNTAVTLGLGGSGLVAVAAGAGGNKFNEMDMEVANDPTRKISPAQFYASGILFGLGEYVTEKVSLGQARGALNYLGFGKKTFGKAFNELGEYSAEVISKSKALRKTFQNWGVNMTKEGSAEFSAQLLNNLTDINILNKKDMHWSDGLAESFVSGSLMSGLGFNAPALVGGIANTFRTESESNKFNKRGKEILRIRKEINRIQNNTGVANEASSQEAVSALQLELDNIVEQNVLDIGTAAARVDELTNNDKRKLLDLDKKIFLFKNVIDNINSNEKLNQKSKEGLIKDKVRIIEVARIEKNKILTSSQNSKAKENQKKIQMQLAAEAGLEFNIVNAKKPEEAIEQADLMVDKAFSEGKITSEQKSGLKESIAGLRKEAESDSKALDINGQYLGAEFGLPIAISLEDNLIENGYGSTVLHETGHATVFGELVKGGGDIIGIVSDMEKFVNRRYKGAKARLNEADNIADQQNSSDLVRAEEKMAIIAEYVAEKDLSKDLTFQGKLLDKWNKIKPKGKGKEITSIKTGEDVFNLINSFARSFDKGELSGLALKVAKGEVKAREKTKEQESKKTKDKVSKKTFSRIISPNAEFLKNELTNEELVASVKSKATEDVFSVAQAIVEKNFGLIRDSNVLTFDKSNPAQINAVKEILEEQILGVFEGSGRGKYSARKTGLFNAYESTKEDGASPSTYLLGVIKTRKPEIDIALKERTIKSEGDSIDSDQAKQVVDKSTKTSATVDKLAKKPTETTKFKSNYISPEFKESLDTSKSEKEAIEDKISSTVKESFKDRKVSRFKETGKIPQKLAQLYADMFGIKTTSALIEKQRNLQKLDQEGAVRARQFLIDNAASDFARLPRSKDDTNKATGILQTKIGKVLYNKAGELTGSLKTYTDIIKGKNITLEGYDGKQYEFNQLDSEGNKKPIYRDAQHIKAALDFHIRNRALETLIPEQGKRIQAGAKFSRVNKKTLNLIAQAKNINEATKLAGIKNKITVNDTNRAEKQDQMFNFITSGNIPSIIFEAGKFGNFGKWNRRGKIVGGVLVPLPKPAPKYFKTKDGRLIKEGSKEYALAEKNGNFLATRGGLYYGVKDPAYIKALQASRDNDSNYPKLQKAKRVNEKSAFTDKGQRQSEINLDTLQVMAEVLADAVHSKGMPIEIAALYISSSYQATTGIIKLAGKFKYRSEKMEYGPADSKSGQRTGAKFREEHNPPASTIGAYLIYAISKNEVKPFMSIIRDNYYQTLLSKADDHKLDMAKLDSRLPEGTSILDNSAIRLVEAGIDINSLINPFTKKTMAEELGVSLNRGDRSLDNIAEQNKLLRDLILEEGIYKNPQEYLNNFVKLSSKAKASSVNNKNAPSNTKFSRKTTNKEALDNLSNIDKALSIARNPEAPIKKIRVFDFDDTLARTKSNVLYTMPDGTTGAIDAATFAKEAGNMEAKGAEWDFSEFSKVMQGSKGPLLDVAKIIADKRGTKDVFVLTARPANAAGPIKEFLESMGLSIPLENITGLGDGTPQAKARWIVDKAANGYNDFYFADDHTGNVKAVKDALSVLDVKSKVQQAKVKFSRASKLNKDFNDIIEGATGIASEKIYGKAKAQVAGASRGKVFRGIAYSAQDFVGLLYETLGKGKEGDAQMAWYKQNLLDPYARAMNDLSSARLAMMNDYRALKKQLGIVPKNLRKKLPGEPWTREQAVRVYVWSKQGTEVPGISKNDLKDLNSFVANNAELQVFADQLIAIQKGDMYPEPGESWVSGGISTDMLRGLNTIKRVKYLEQWQANVDAIFSKENKNKLEAAYGIKYVKALENSLQRMKTGRNRSFSDDSLTGRFTDWLQGSVGAIMFFNTRSAILQTLSAVNFVNFTDNNPYAAAKAFGNQKQYWKDFTTLMNSDFLKERRSGLRINVSEADIADMAKQEGPRGVINKLLQLGFAPTQIADSFAIASGGATFYRNRAKTYMKEGMDQAQAEEKAFQDFRENAEESQQSSRPDKISAQQAGPLGRLILAFANTPAQYARLTDKAIRDLKNGRGDAKTNISKIIYYTTVQNIIFNAVQQALFAMAFGDEEPEDEKKQEKYVSIANGMADSLLRGTGIAGSVISVGKNAIIRIIKESKKKRPKYEKVGYELLKISPPISAKISRINQAARAYEWNKEEMMTKGFSLDNPAFLAGGNVVSALTNIPLDRVVKKVNNVVKATESDLELWERVALFAGWQDWELGIKKEEKPKKRKLIKRKQTFKTRKFKTRKFN